MFRTPHSSRLAREGTERACHRSRRSSGSGVPNLNAGGPIRALSVSLLAVVAVAVSVLIARQRPDKVNTSREVPAGENQPLRRSLDAIRAAGL
mgnify:CR=1 FL=1